MVTATTHNVRVSVLTNYQEGYSSPTQSHFVFSYRVQIENEGDSTLQLRRRHWTIFDSDGTIREVEGEGVIGQQPVLEPGESHEYISGCNLHSDLGKMVGHYTFERLLDGTEFEVAIPEFLLVHPAKLN